jgi:uncharacterized membrane protein
MEEGLGVRTAEYVHIGRRNNSLSRSGRLLALCYLGGVSLGIALGFGLVLGAWPLLPFAGLEVLVLCLAFAQVARHAGDYERVVIGGDRVKVEVVDGKSVRCFELNRHWAQVVRDPQEGRLALRSHGRELEIGRHLCTEQRVLLAGELERELHGASFEPRAAHGAQNQTKVREA